ncbi:MAG: 2-oxo acid dehydrogenase subunit E2, partial [Actinomycetota bacterium]|nr:2-oxo acid dehydrogenase subunit E2 [Actinomycetota bacterium]
MATSKTTVQIVMPAMGESVTEGVVLAWHRQVGERVAVDEPLVEVSTDKVDTDIPSPADGVLAKVLVGADETAQVGTVLGEIETGAAPEGLREDAPRPTPVTTDGHDTQAANGAGDRSSRAATEDGGNGDVNATPVAARMAARHGLDLGEIPGSGPRGRVTKEDVQAAVADGPTASGDGGAAAPAGARLTPIRGPAATLARLMDESRAIPTATSFRTVPVDSLDAHRRQLKAAGRRLSFTHLIAWAIVQAAKDMPVMAHSFVEVDGKPQRVTPGAISLGLAVDVERRDGTRSLVVPVVADAGEKGFAEFVSEYDRLVAGARDNALPPDAYGGANITLTNPGGIGTVASVPRLMPGQGTIVATGAIGYPPGLTGVDPDRLTELGVSKVMTMTSTYDHRVIQGAESGAFLKRVEELLQGAQSFYEEAFAALGLDAARSSQEEAGDAPITADDPAPAAATPAVAAVPDEALLQAVQAATSVVKAHRMHGHLAATLDPLGSPPRGDPALNPESVNLTPELMRRIPASVLRVAVPGETFADALPHLADTYTGTIAYEIEHIAGHKRRVWLRQTIESGAHRRPLSPEDKRRLLARLSEVEALESYLHKAFLGKKQFSIEGLDVLVAMLDEAIELSAGKGARELVLGMAHRGRLNVLAHTVGRPYKSILVEFEGEQTLSADTAAPEGGTGDVKYHYGASGTYKTRAGRGVTVSLSPNPSHLEYVNPVIEGRARADQTSRRGGEIVHDPSLVVPVLIHGDAAFPGQGVVAETLNLQALAGYSTGGTLHIIANNQLGFTTDPSESRSTRYASDLAKGYDVPIIHV